MDRAGPGARGWADASGGSASLGPAQELGVPAAGAFGALEHGRERGSAFGPAGSSVGAATGAVARGQPRSGAGVDPPRNADGSGSERRDRPVARRQRRTGGVRAGATAASVGAAAWPADGLTRPASEPSGQLAGEESDASIGNVDACGELAADAERTRVA